MSFCCHLLLTFFFFVLTLLTGAVLTLSPVTVILFFFLLFPFTFLFTFSDFFFDEPFTPMFISLSLFFLLFPQSHCIIRHFQASVSHVLPFFPSRPDSYHFAPILSQRSIHIFIRAVHRSAHPIRVSFSLSLASPFCVCLSSTTAY